MNIGIYTGKLSNTPEVKTAKSGTKYCNFSISQRKAYRSKNDEPGKTQYEFINFVAFGGVADYLGKHGHKGDFVNVNATASQNVMEINGKKYYSTKLTATLVEIIFSADHADNAPNATQEYDGVNFDDVDTSDIDPDALPF